MSGLPDQPATLLFFKDYLKQHYGRTFHRLSFDLPLSCPNRNPDGSGGCIFCDADGARARHLQYHLDIAQQAADGISYLQRRYQASPPYIAYFQSFSNTYAPVAQLRRWHDEALRQADFKLVIIATRPDCLPNEIVDYLSELNQSYELWVELGVQSAHDRTLQLLERGHNFAAVRDAVTRLAARGIKCAAHVILGLPGETIDDYQKTAVQLARLPFSGIKIHQLMILRHTKLEKLYKAPDCHPPILPLNEYDYARALAKFLRLIPTDWPIMRLTADAPPEQLIAPVKKKKKGQFIEFFKQYYRQAESDAPMAVTTNDGSKTLYHPGYRQHFHTLAGAASEAEYKFILPARLDERLKQQEVKLLDIGLGLGYNLFAAIEHATRAEGKIKIITLENELQNISAALAIFKPDSQEYTILNSLLTSGKWHNQYAEVKLLSGDARKSVTTLTEHFDLIFMDGFSPDKNPALWSFNFIRQLTRLLDRQGAIVTYSSAFPVRGALLKAGLQVGESLPFGRRRGGTVAAHDLSLCVGEPLSQKERNIIYKSTAGVPYFDHGLNKSEKEILNHRKKLVARLRKYGIPKWYKPA